jgi:hypothetical protein
MGRITCHRCGAARDATRLPRGWKRHPEDVTWCDRCWRGAYVLRAVTFPVAGPVDGTWQDLREALRSCWASATTVANWAVRELAQADVVRTPEMPKLPPLPTVYLYPGARKVAPKMDTASLVSLLQAVQLRYRAMRYDVIWRRAAALPTYRYPTPYPVHNQSWMGKHGPDGEALILVRLAGRRWTLRLRGGREFWRQLQAFRALVEGQAMQGELALYERRASAGDHRVGTTPASRLMAKLIIWLPRRPEGERERRGTLVVRSDSASLLAYHLDGEDEVHHYHADHVRRWLAEHARRLQRTADDAKAEHRRPGRLRRRRAQVRSVWSAKHARRMDTLTHEMSAVIAGYADRRGVARVELDAGDSGYVASFPWSTFTERLRYKLDAIGVVLDTRGAAATESPEAPEVEA